MRRFPFLKLILVFTVLPLGAQDFVLHTFKKSTITNKFWSEGAAIGDLNRDGHNDVIAGPYWYEGPKFKKRHEFRPATATFTAVNGDGKKVTIAGYEGALGKNDTYSDDFLTFVYDINGDGWPDILQIGEPGSAAIWYENPGKDGLRAGTPWKKHVVFQPVDNESPVWGDLFKNGRPVLLCMSGGHIGYASPDWKNPALPWTFHSISPKGPYYKWTHGLGYGDVNGDVRMDILEANGWWEQPDSLAGDPLWKFHPVAFASGPGQTVTLRVLGSETYPYITYPDGTVVPYGGSQMFAYDVNGDGLPDVITVLAAHGYGLAWWEQLKQRGANGEIEFKQHIIIDRRPDENKYGVKFSQMHSLALVDIDGDGVKDLVTGKRFWAHGSDRDAEPNAPAVLYWFKLVRGPNGSVDYVPHLIDDDSGVGTQVAAGNIGGNGLPGIVVANKKGIFVFLQKTRRVSKAEWEKAQPEVKFPDAGKQADVPVPAAHQ